MGSTCRVLCTVRPCTSVGVSASVCLYLCVVWFVRTRLQFSPLTPEALQLKEQLSKEREHQQRLADELAALKQSMARAAPVGSTASVLSAAANAVSNAQRAIGARDGVAVHRRGTPGTAHSSQCTCPGGGGTSGVDALHQVGCCDLCCLWLYCCGVRTSASLPDDGPTSVQSSVLSWGVRKSSLYVPVLCLVVFYRSSVHVCRSMGTDGVLRRSAAL